MEYESEFHRLMRRVLAVLAIVAGVLALVGLIAAHSPAHAQPVYVPPGVVIEHPRHHYAPPPHPYCDRDCQWRRYRQQREYDREHYYEHRWDWR